jgi:hypothetical protein
MLRRQRGGTPTAVNLSFLDRSRYLLFQVAPHLCTQGWMNPVPDPLLLRKYCNAGNRIWDLWCCSQELWLLDHRGGHQLCIGLGNWKDGKGPAKGCITIIIKKLKCSDKQPYQMKRPFNIVISIHIHYFYYYYGGRNMWHEWERRGTCIGYWYESQRGRDH